MNTGTKMKAPDNFTLELTLIGHNQETLLSLVPVEGGYKLTLTEPSIFLTPSLLDDLAALCFDGILYHYLGENDDGKSDNRTPDSIEGKSDSHKGQA